MTDLPSVVCVLLCALLAASEGLPTGDGGGLPMEHGAAKREAPRWPDHFNATLAKINPNNNNVVWTKLFYDWRLFEGGASRFDFFNGYVADDGSWSLNCSVLFRNYSIWFVFPDEEACHLRATDIPSVNPDWVRLLNATFEGTTDFRGIDAEVWDMADPDDPSHTMRYYATAANNSIPLRSPNQINDPGNTDFFDVAVGAQDPALFAVPHYCESRQVDKGCPWY